MHHEFDNEDNSSILIELGAVSVVNHIQMSLYSLEEDSYSYFIEVSVDMRNWHQVVDHSNFLCRSLQNLYFPCRTVRYIRLVGTRTPTSDVSYITSIHHVLFSNFNRAKRVSPNVHSVFFH